MTKTVSCCTGWHEITCGAYTHLVDEHARALEEQWMDSMGSVDSGSVSQSTSQTTSVMLNGIVLGFFFPIIPFFFFREIKPAVIWEEGPDHDIVDQSPLS